MRVNAGSCKSMGVVCLSSAGGLCVRVFLVTGSAFPEKKWEKGELV